MVALGHGINKEAALAMRDKYNLTYFVETGTYVGATALWAAQHFAFVYTIEIYPDYHRVAKQTLALDDNVECVLGDVVHMLPDILWMISEQGESALIYLDAYWTPSLSYDKPKNICPIEYSVDIINEYRFKHVVMVDASVLPGNMKIGTRAYTIPTRRSVTTILGSTKKRQIELMGNCLVAEPWMRADV